LRSPKRRLVWLVALLAVIGLVAAACGSDDDSSGGDSPGTTEGSSEGSGFDYASCSGSLSGRGASFPEAFYQEAIAEFSSVAPDLDMGTYQGVGSGTGKKDLASELIDWAGSDSLVSDPADFPREFFYFPTVAAPITISYNLDGVDELKLSPDTLAGIFMGEITEWDASEIAADNEGVDLPSEAITVAVRADGSGTTNNFSKYLVAAAPDVFTLEAGDTVAWPKSQAGQGNGGVAQIISDTSGAIGYVDLSDANSVGLSYAEIQNKDGEFVGPTLEGATAALDGAEVNDDLTYNPLDASGAEAYPITAPTYILTYQTYSDATTVENLKCWITYVLTDAQSLAADVDFAALPEGLDQQALDQVDQITSG
jgi:phosphate transport system substrate-binding protein